jgi:hypothetical protein
MMAAIAFRILCPAGAVAISSYATPGRVNGSTGQPHKVDGLGNRGKFPSAILMLGNPPCRASGFSNISR